MEPWAWRMLPTTSEARAHGRECTHGSVDYSDTGALQFKSLKLHSRGAAFQQSFILIDESQNLTPHQIKTIITRGPLATKVVCLGNLAQIDTPLPDAPVQA